MRSIFISIAIMLLAIYCVVDTLTSGYNMISQLVKYLGAGALIAGFANPKMGFWMLIVTFGYIDTLKRLLVVGGFTSFNDITIILAFPAILCSLIFLSLLYTKFVNRSVSAFDRKLLLIWLGVSILMGGLALSEGLENILGVLKNAANYVGYVSLIFIVPQLFPTYTALMKMFKGFVIIFIPVGIYTFIQFAFGLADFELAYLETGLSLEARILYGQDFRFFSTLNSSQNLAKVGGMMAAFVLCNGFYGGRQKIHLLLRLPLFAMFAYCVYLSGARTGAMMGAFAIIAYFFLQYRFLTISFYVMCITGFVALVLSANYIVETRMLDVVSRWVADFVGETDGSYTNLGTLTIRFIGLSQWTEPDFWTFFGHRATGEELYNQFPHHDIFTRMMLSIGVVPMGVIGSIGAILLFKLHKNLLMRKSYYKSEIVFFSLVACVVFGGLAAGANLGTFPVTCMMYVFGGGIASLHLIRTKEKLELEYLQAQQAMEGSADDLLVQS